MMKGDVLMSLHQSFAEWARWFWPTFFNHLWQATLVAFAALIAAMILRKSSPHARSVVCSIALVKFLLPSALLLWSLSCFNFYRLDRVAEKTGSLLPSVSWPAVADSRVRVVFQIAQPLPEVVPQPEPGVEERHNEICCALTLVWLLGAMVLMTKWMVRHRQFARDLGEGRLLLVGRETEALDRARRRLETKSEIRLIESDRVHEPGVWRVMRPAIVIPAGLAEQLCDEELDAIMMHE